MEKKNRIIALFLAGILLLTTGCGKSKDSPAESTVPAETVTAEQTAAPVSPEASLNSLRQTMVGTPQLFAVAYFGYHDSPDVFEIMQENAYWLCQEMPFLMEIPQDRIIGEGGDLFCIVPLDEEATVAVSKGYWDDENQQHIYDDMLYSSAAGEPILLFCNNAGWEPDTQVYISGESGEVFWYPQEDDNRCASSQRNEDGEVLFRDFSPYRELLMAKHSGMKDSGWSMPTKESLIGTSWSCYDYLKDYRNVSYQVTFEEDILSVRWYDGIDENPHEYLYAPWELSYDEGFAILEIDFRELAGVLRYNLLYDENLETLYVAMDAVQEEMPIGWEPLYRFLLRSVAPQPTDLIGEWELVWTEVEGDRIEAEPGKTTVGIMSAASGGLLMSYISEDFPDNNFYDELLTIDARRMHILCGNDEWVADLDYVGPWDTTYAVTLTSEDILIKQNYFLLDGAPTVSYEYFLRIGECLECGPGEYNVEDPYAYAISQGWEIPELSQLSDTLWLSQWNAYALELFEDAVPGNNGGWAMIYDVDDIGAYTESYSGSWTYADGQLSLSLVPLHGDGIFVDDSFPVLILDDELRIGRTANGTGLPHFYADTLMDTLQQPKG